MRRQREEARQESSGSGQHSTSHSEARTTGSHRRGPTPPPLRLLRALILLGLAAQPIIASVGDRSSAYHRCLGACDTALCAADSSSTSLPADSPFKGYPRSSFLWSCDATCKYACQKHLTDLALSEGPSSSAPSSLQASGGTLQGLPLGQQVQFHGKWPFHRLDLSSTFPFSIPPISWIITPLIPAAQEPLSVLFSLLNLWAHYKGFVALLHLARAGRMPEGRALARTYAIYAVGGMNAWVWSSVFHTRDVDWTERADYFSAALTILLGVWSVVVRITGWYAPPGKHAKPLGSRVPSLFFTLLRRPPFLLFTLACTTVYSFHIFYLTSTPRFNYSYNMLFNVLLALTTILLWGYWSFSQSRLPSPSNFSRRQLSSYPSARARFRAPHHLSPLLPMVALPALTALELLDFPPFGPFGLRILDAHALWHASTIVVVQWWYRFLVADVRWIDGQGEGGDPSSVLPGNSATGTNSGPPGEGRSTVAESLLSGAALAKRRMTGLGAGLGLGIFGGWESRKGSLAAMSGIRAGERAAQGERGGAGGGEGAGGGTGDGKREE
ncbi:hypothetical protein JCM11251_005962 [Rhodosporidiobolus azoricus]